MLFNTREEIIAMTPEWTGERFEDGRPKVADKYLDALYGMTLEELSEALNTEIVIVDTGGRDLVEAVINPPEHKKTRRRQIYEQTSSSDSGKA